MLKIFYTNRWICFISIISTLSKQQTCAKLQSLIDWNWVQLSGRPGQEERLRESIRSILSRFVLTLMKKNVKINYSHMLKHIYIYLFVFLFQPPLSSLRCVSGEQEQLSSDVWHTRDFSPKELMGANQFRKEIYSVENCLIDLGLNRKFH